MLIKELPDLVTASKADWLPGTTYLGFTPQGRGPSADAQCASTVQRQFGRGYVLERITQSFGEPNDGFNDDPQVIHDRDAHEKLRDRLVAVHRLRHSMRPLKQVIGELEYERLQDIWSADTERRRWSVAFPIIETYELVDKPKARDVFAPKMFDRLYRTQSATLRILDDEARAEIAELEIKRIEAPNAWIAIEDEIVMAEGSELPPIGTRNITRDLAGALEGESEERRAKIARRAAWLAHRFASDRRSAGTLFCDDCGFDPRRLTNLEGIAPRSCFDVHHMNPLAEGVRYTTVQDFALLCPTCHRIEHLRLRSRRSQQA